LHLIEPGWGIRMLKFIAALALFFAQSTFAGISYFGYFSSASDGLYDAIPYVSANSNTVFIASGSTSVVLQKLAEAQSRGMMAIVDVQHILFPWSSSLLCTSSTCATDYATAFYLFHQAIKAYDYMIAAYYIFDEPYWNNYLASIGQNGNYTFTYNSNLYWNLYSAVATVHTYAPGKPTAIVFGFPTMQGNGSNFQWMIPVNLDWIGFDGYVADGCNDQCATNNFNTLAAIARRTGQKLIAVVDAYWKAPPTLANESSVLDRINLWKQLIAANANQVVAVLPFQFQTNASMSLYGADSMPLVNSCLSVYYQQLRGYAYCSGTALVDSLNPWLVCYNDISCR